ncbi:hypothetical protein [Vibrio sp.]|uniref:hypothetical protein n=1 Tax=Vibrio sp. TaxID=678 RepID=UPI003F6D3971
MKSFLITGARAPVALEIARNLKFHEHKVIMADSIRYPLAKNSYCVDAFYVLPSPKDGIEGYLEALIEIILIRKIQYLIPTCEEVFYISSIRESLAHYCQVICPEFSLIKKLHSKYEILTACEGFPIRLPNTTLINDMALIDDTIQVNNHKKLQSSQLKNCIVKREFCRFGTDVLLQPSINSVHRMQTKASGRLLLQEKILGTEYCTYAIAISGKVYAQTIYQPAHRVKVAAGIYFKPVEDIRVSTFVEQFCLKHQYTGQIGFDVIVNENGVHLIECNPRATSGVHLLSEVNLAEAFIAKCYQEQEKLPKPRMLAFAMLGVSLPLALKNRQYRNWLNDFKQASDVISCTYDNSSVLHLICSITELCFIAVKHNVSIRAASTQDIEWDGEDIH